MDSIFFDDPEYGYQQHRNSYGQFRICDYNIEV